MEIRVFRNAVSDSNVGDIAQLARASALQAEGQGFESPYLQEYRIATAVLYKRFLKENHSMIFDIMREGSKTNNNLNAY